MALNTNVTLNYTPPRYANTNELPPNYNTGIAPYIIGGRMRSAPLVSDTHVKAHLRLLRAISNLKTIIEEGKDARIPRDALELFPPQRWAWFTGLAVERFARWVPLVRALPRDQWILEELPPLDVLMVWHAYLLNPLWYAEDCARIPALSTLKNLGGRLLSSLVQVEDISLYSPTPQLRSLWLERTQTVYDPLDAMGSLRFHRIACPQCGTAVDAPFLSPDGTGYLQNNFMAQCYTCSLSLTKDTLSVMKFARDLVIDPLDSKEVERYGPGVYMAGTYYSPFKGPSAERATNAKLRLRECYPLAKPAADMSAAEWQQHILKSVSYTMKPLKAAILSQLTVKGYNTQRVLSAYTDDRLFSADLLGAVVRQSTFIEKLHSLHWLDEGHFGENAEDDLVLRHAISRYHAFLDLLSCDPRAVLVPTLDIDLVWHTHQMRGITYLGHCAKYARYFIDHYDKVEQHYLSARFDATCRAWRERFSIPYSFCGCPDPGDNMEERITRFRQLFLRAPGPTGELIPLRRPDAILATHASDHNAVPVLGDESLLYNARVEKVTKRQKRAVKRGGQSEKTHDPPFMYPLEVYIGTDNTSIIAGHVATQFDWVVKSDPTHSGSIMGTHAGYAFAAGYVFF